MSCASAFGKLVLYLFFVTTALVAKENVLSTVSTQKQHYIQNAVLDSRLHRPYIERDLTLSALTRRSDCI